MFNCKFSLLLSAREKFNLCALTTFLCGTAALGTYYNLTFLYVVEFVTLESQGWRMVPENFSVLGIFVPKSRRRFE